MVIDEVARRYGVTTWKKKDGAQQAHDAARGIVFVKPVTFMNLSGTPVRLISSWYRTPPAGVLVVSDDMDLPFGKLRMRPAAATAATTVCARSSQRSARSSRAFASGSAAPSTTASITS